MLDETATDPRLQIGGNNPPEPTPFEALLAEANERIDVATKWLTERPAITDRDMSDKAGGFKGQIAATRKAIDDMRLEEGRQFAAAQKEKYGSILDLLAKSLALIQDRLTAWLQAENARLKREKEAAEAEARRQQEVAAAARRAAEGAARQAGADALRIQQQAEEIQRKADAATKAAAAPVRAMVKGDFTTRAMTLRETWHARVVDQKAALKHYGKHVLVQEAALAAALKLAEAEAKLTKRTDAAPPGFEFYSDEKAA